MSTSSEGLSADHRALLYHDASRFVGAVGAFVRHGLGNGDRVLAAVTPEKETWLREDLGADAELVDFADASVLYVRLGPMFRTVMDYLERHGTPGRGRVRIVAEQALALRAPADRRAYMRYEAASNVAYTRYAASVLCPYDAKLLPDEILRDALCTHPRVLEDGRTRPNDRFVDPRSFIRRDVRVGAAPPGTPAHHLERLEDVAVARALVRAHAQAAGLAREAIEDLMVAVSEVAANALLHGHAPRRLWSYIDDGTLVCQVHDAGSGLADPLAGYLAPDTTRLNGRGLWLAHQLCDIVEIASDPTGTRIKLHVTVPSTA